MLTDIQGLHHVTSMAGNAQQNNDFFTKTLGLRRVKKTVNFDSPDVYHLYYGDETGAAGTVMTYFPFPDIARGKPGTGEVGETLFSVPRGSLGYWKERFSKQRVSGLQDYQSFGENRLRFRGPDGDGFALVEADDDKRAPFKGSSVPTTEGVHGFRGVTMRLRDGGATGELLKYMGYEVADRHKSTTRYVIKEGNGADYVDIEVLPGAQRAQQGAGSVHHVAFAVEDLKAQQRVRKALMDTGFHVTPIIDRDYFWAIYFRTPGGVLFEIATHEPGFNRDEDTAHLGEALKLPEQHAYLRPQLEQILPTIKD